MKNNFKKIGLLMCIVSFLFSKTFSQPLNQNADPSATAVTWSMPSLPQGTNSNLTFTLGNNGTDPLPAEKVEWTINIPLSRVTVGLPAFIAPDGSANTGLYEYLRIVSGTTVVVVLRSHTDIPPTSAFQPQDQYKAVYPVTGAIIGGPTYATLNAAIVSGKLSQVGNASPSNDNSSAAILVSPAASINTIYPNPASNIININIANIPAGKSTAQFYDAAGRLIMSSILTTGFNQVDVSRLVSGTYTIAIEGAGQTYKIVIAK